jgi:hypothetical protein
MPADQKHDKNTIIIRSKPDKNPITLPCESRLICIHHSCHANVVTSGQEKFERTINSLQQIKTVDPRADREILLAGHIRVRTDLLDAAQLFLALQRIETTRITNRQMLRLSFGMYEQVLLDAGLGSRGRIKNESQELESIFKAITGPVTKSEVETSRYVYLGRCSSSSVCLSFCGEWGSADVVCCRFERWSSSWRHSRKHRRRI